MNDVLQLAFKRWTEQRYWEVVAIYEDRHEVAVVGAGGRLMRKSIPFKRTKVLHVRHRSFPEMSSSLLVSRSQVVMQWRRPPEHPCRSWKRSPDGAQGCAC